MSSNKVLDKTGLTYLWSKFIAYLENIFPAIGNSDMGTTATTLTGAIAEHEIDIANLNSKFITVLHSGDLGALSAGATGYATATVTIPSGYVTRGIAQCYLRHPSSANGLHIMPNVDTNKSGSYTFYPSYHAPKAVAAGQGDYIIHILCSKQ